MDNEESHIIPYRTFLYVLALLITLTLTSVAVTRIYLGTLTVAAALLIAVVKSSFVLRIFMHLKFENNIYYSGYCCYFDSLPGNNNNSSGLPL
jgi:cytochrome c oxidase subunit 4